MTMELSQFDGAKAGTSVVLQDFHTLEALGEKYVGVLKDVRRDAAGGSQIKMLFVSPAEGVELAVVAFSGIPELATPTYRMYRLFTSGPAAKIDDPRFANVQHQLGMCFIPFRQRFDDTPENEDAIDFNICLGFPIKTPKMSFCAWEGDPNRVDQNYWARHCLAEVSSNGFARVWFGWDITPEDVELVVV